MALLEPGIIIWHRLNAGNHANAVAASSNSRAGGNGIRALRECGAQAVGGAARFWRRR